MLRILTAFDYSKNNKPLRSIIVDENNDIYFYDFYVPNSKLTLKQIELNIKLFQDFLCRECIINDFKTHISTFNLHKNTDYKVYSIPIIKQSECSKKSLLESFLKIDWKQQKWQLLLAKASVVYQHLEDNGLFDGYLKVHPKYNSDVFTGRSSTSDFNIQGTTKDFNIKHVNSGNMFIHFDWVSADLRMAAHISNDENMINCYKESDPNTIITNHLNGELDRDAVKKALFRAFYSMKIDSPIMDCFPQFREWARKRILKLQHDNFLESIMGRKFICDGQNQLSVFNAQFQGSVAHAMNALLVKLFNRFPDYIVCEIHDSIVLCCDNRCVKDVIRNTVQLMLNPLDGWVDNPPRMPVQVSVGDKWKLWQRFKTYR